MPLFSLISTPFFLRIDRAFQPQGCVFGRTALAEILEFTDKWNSRRQAGQFTENLQGRKGALKEGAKGRKEGGGGGQGGAACSGCDGQRECHGPSLNYGASQQLLLLFCHPTLFAPAPCVIRERAFQTPPRLLFGQAGSGAYREFTEVKQVFVPKHPKAISECPFGHLDG